MHEKEKEILLQLWQVHKVIVFYLKIMDEWKGKNDQQIFRDQIFIQRIVNVLLRSEKRTNILHVRDRILSRFSMLESLFFRKFRRFVLKILKILQLYDFKIKIAYCTILLGNMNT